MYRWSQGSESLSICNRLINFLPLQIDELGASDFRTRAALEKTMEHLRGIMDQPANKARIHNFLFDRYRSVRQDLYVQGLQVPHSSTLHSPSACLAGRICGSHCRQSPL